MPNLFDDESFADRLVKLIASDSATLRRCGILLTPGDFKPLRGMKWGRQREIFAEISLNFFKKYQNPAGDLLTSQVLGYANKLNLDPKDQEKLKEYGVHLSKLRVTAPDAIIDQIANYKKERFRAKAIDELVSANSAGTLTDEKWHEVFHRSQLNGSIPTSTNFFDLKELEKRNERRRLNQKRSRCPFLFIDPLDSLIRMVAPKQMGLILAPYKAGKSLFLLWIAIAYVIQGYNVLFFTLENSKDDVEDRLDAIVTHIPIKILNEVPIQLTRRFERFKTMIRSQIHIIDGTDGGLSVSAIEQIWLQERTNGFHAHASIVDYDDEIVPPNPKLERRFQFADIYRSLRQFGSRRNQLLWTAAQTQRDTEHLKVITGNKAAEDISKLRKVSVALGLGKGDWGEDSRYINVAAHNFDSANIGVNVKTDFSRQLIYDRDATQRAMQQAENEKEES